MQNEVVKAKAVLAAVMEMKVAVMSLSLNHSTNAMQLHTIDMLVRKAYNGVIDAEKAAKTVKVRKCQ